MAIAVRRKGWRRGMAVDGTIEHAYVSTCTLVLFENRISLVTEPAELFEVMVKIMRPTSVEGETFHPYPFTLCTVC